VRHEDDGHAFSGGGFAPPFRRSPLGITADTGHRGKACGSNEPGADGLTAREAFIVIVTHGSSPQ
jgi:hypothetical protein